MDITFITIHGLSCDFPILYASESISDVLGYQPSEVVNRSTFDFFHPEELPLVREQHRKTVKMDHAAVLAYIRIKDKHDVWIGCECVFSCVYDVIVAATTIYRSSIRSASRALAAPVIQEAFQQNNQSELRQEMLTYMSAKFTSIAPNLMKETRCALILNRFTRSATILYSTYASEDLLGLSPDHLTGSSFFSYVAPECLAGTMDALDRAKENDSIAYLRFRWNTWKGRDHNGSVSSSSTPSLEAEKSGSSSDRSLSPDQSHDTFDVEAVVSCSSDGVVVVMRRCAHISTPAEGLFAVPWATRPLYPAPPEPLVSSKAGTTRSRVGERVMQSIQDISVFVWGMYGAQDVLARHAIGKPGPLATMSTSDIDRHQSNDMSILQDTVRHQAELNKQRTDVIDIDSE